MAMEIERATLDGVATPAVIVDLDVVEANVSTMAAEMRRRGVALRPHAKTHKSIQLARMQVAAGAAGITVGTIGEAEIFAAGGIRDIFIAYPVVPAGPKAARFRALADACDLSVGFDSAAGVAAIAAAARGAARAPRLLLEIDCGGHRTGVVPARAAEVATGGRAAASAAGLEMVGVFTFGGHAYAGPGARDEAADQEVTALAEAAASLTAAGIRVEIVSAGSTPTALRSARGAVTEERPGTYIFGDAMQVALGSATWDSVALRVVTTVVSTAVDGQFVVDAGAKVLSQDTAPYVRGHGLFPAYPTATLTRLNDYHGLAQVPEGSARPGVGEVVSIIPNHVCPVVNLVDEFVVVRGGRIVGRWPVDARGQNG
jgi:D-serine deaminase-like pyridoxal phosphate-dependent protein